MKICFVGHSSRKGGADLVLIETIEALQAKGIECRVLLPNQGELCTELDRIGVPFSIISYAHWMTRGKVPFFRRLKAALNIAAKTIIATWKILRWECDVVYTNTATICVGALAARLLFRPHIWHLHEFGMEDQGLSFLFGNRFSLALINRFSSRCICVSRALSKKYGGLFLDPSIITVIYPSMHRALAAQSGNTYQDPLLFKRSVRFRCMIVGALIEGKGQEESILALAYLKQRGIDAELIILGEGLHGYRRHLQELILEHDLMCRVYFGGWVDDSIAAMKSADAVLICSKCEAFGRVTIEGMVAGKVVIGARCGATVELIEDGINGLLYNAGDPNDLANKIMYLYENRDVAERLGRNARLWVEDYFTKSRYGEELMTLMASVHKLASSGTL
jgi:glycosyltransferase involved in cell wall biosynthesis